MVLERSTFKIVIKKVERPYSHDIDNSLEWLCRSLGFFEPIDREKTAASILKEILNASDDGTALTSTAIAQRVGMSRGSVINHLNNLMRAGLVARHGRYYATRSKSVFRTVEEIEEDIDRIFSKMKKTAREIDREIGIVMKD